MTNIRLSSVNGPGINPLPESTLESIIAENPTESAVNSTTIDAFGLVNGIRNVSSSVAVNNSPGVEIEVTSEKEFPVRGEMPILKIGAQEFALSRYPESGDTHTLIFTVTQEEFAGAVDGEPVTLQYGRELSGDQWNFGLLEKPLSN